MSTNRILVYLPDPDARMLRAKRYAESVAESINGIDPETLHAAVTTEEGGPVLRWSFCSDFMGIEGEELKFAHHLIADELKLMIGHIELLICELRKGGAV